MNSIKSYEAYHWFPYIKMYFKRGQLYQTWLISDNLKSYYQEVVSNLRQYGKELLPLALLLDEQYYIDPTLAKCLHLYRTTLNDQKKEELNKKLYHMMKRKGSLDTTKSLLACYFIDASDITLLTQFFSSDENENMLLDISIQALSETRSKEEIEQFCLQIQNQYKARVWLLKYYEKHHLYEQGRKFCEPYKEGDALSREEFISILYALMWFYGGLKQPEKRDEIYQRLMKFPNLRRPAIFKGLRSSMTKKEWNEAGKWHMYEWSIGKSIDNRLDLYAHVQAGDLLFMYLLDEQCKEDVINAYESALRSYDVGLLFAIRKRLLASALSDDHMHPQTTMSFFMYYVTREKDQQSFTALKYLLVELQEEFKDNENALKALQEAEEDLYERYEK